MLRLCRIRNIRPKRDSLWPILRESPLSGRIFPRPRMCGTTQFRIANLGHARMNQRLVLAALFAIAAPAPVLAQGASRAEIETLIEQTARAYNVPVAHVHRVVRRESNYNPRASAGGALGLMQIKHATARGVGYRGDASGLFDPATNLKYGIAYFAGAYKLANGDYDQAYRYYNRGYYFAAKARGIRTTVPDDAPVVAAVPAASSATGFASLFGARPAPAAATAQIASADPRLAMVGSPALAYTAASATQGLQAVEVPLPPRRPAFLALDPGAAQSVAALPTATVALAPSPQQAATVVAVSTQVGIVEVPIPPRRPAERVLAAIGRPLFVARAAATPAPVQEASAQSPAQ